MFHVFTFRFFLNFVNRAKGIWSSDNYCDVRLNLKRNELLSSLTWKTLAQKNIKAQKRLVFRLKSLFLLKNMFCLYFSPIAKLEPRKKSHFWSYSKTLHYIIVIIQFIYLRLSCFLIFSLCFFLFVDIFSIVCCISLFPGCCSWFSISSFFF